MPDHPRARTAPEGRVSTGSPELDTMLHGGLLPHRPYLIVGPAGTGKTTLALKFLIEGARRGEETLLVTMEEPPNEMRFNHRLLQPDLDRIWVFDAIPDVMRYERTPFKDVAQVRDSVRFAQVSSEIRKSPELASVEITLTALEQTLKMQRARRPYTRLAIDSLTALQFFCMKGYDEVTGAQSFLKFLSDLDVTSILTVESSWEEAENPERMLARGEIRLFRWEYEGSTVRAIGVEKFRGSAHDVRLHPYRIGANGIDIRLNETISRDTRIIARISPEMVTEQHEAPIVVTVGAEPAGVDPVTEILDGISAELKELAQARLDLGAIRGSLDAARQALGDGQLLPAQNALIETRGLVRQMTLGYRSSQPRPTTPVTGSSRAARAPPDLPDVLLPPEQLQRMVDHLTSVLPSREPATTIEPEIVPSEPPVPPQGLEAATEVPAPPSELGTATAPLMPTVEPAMASPAAAPAPSVVTMPEHPPRRYVAEPTPAAPSPTPASTPSPASVPTPPPPTPRGPAATGPTAPTKSLPPLSAHPAPSVAPRRTAPAPAPAPVHPEHAVGVSFGPTFESLDAPRSTPTPAPARPTPPAASEPPAQVTTVVIPPPAAAPAGAPAPVPGPVVVTLQVSLPPSGPATAGAAAPAPAVVVIPSTPAPAPPPAVLPAVEPAGPALEAAPEAAPSAAPPEPVGPAPAAPPPKRRRKAAAPGTGTPRRTRAPKATSAAHTATGDAAPAPVGSETASAPPPKTSKPRARRKKVAPVVAEGEAVPPGANPVPPETSKEAPTTVAVPANPAAATEPTGSTATPAADGGAAP